MTGVQLETFKLLSVSDAKNMLFYYFHEANSTDMDGICVIIFCIINWKHKMHYGIQKQSKANYTNYPKG